MNKLETLSIKTISTDSRTLKPGALFIALPGINQDERASYIEEAIKKGAVMILSEGNLNFLKESEKLSVPLIPFSNLKAATGYIAAQFYDDPSSKLSVIGVTGTNGKTSVTHYIAQALNKLESPCAVMGTLGNGWVNKLKKTSHTTLDAVSIQSNLSDFLKEGACVVAMEVTSHALMQERVSGVHFNTAIFMNLTRDHLDYHQTMSSYFEAKQKLFTKCRPRAVVVNLDDTYGLEIIKHLDYQNQKVIGFTTHSAIRASIPEDVLLITTPSLEFRPNGFKVCINTPWGEGIIDCALVGDFNVSNVLATLAAICLQGFPLELATNAISKLKTVKGRMDKIGGKTNPTIIVDYAHTPDALKQVLESIKQHCQGKLWCVFGCGGDRDRGKRPLMAEIAECLSDKVIVTQDNPRTEDPEQIIKDILQGLERPNQVHIEIDRLEAIQYAVLNSEAADWIVVAGKGHEEVQIIGEKRLPFSDKIAIKEALLMRNRHA